MFLMVMTASKHLAVIWLSREPKRKRTDHAVLQCRGKQEGTR